MKTISQIANQYSVSLRALRFYEEIGLMKPARAATTRFYDESEETRLRLILAAKRLGFTLREIDKIVRSRDVEGPVSEEHIDIRRLLTAPAIRQRLEHLEKRRDDVLAAITELEARLHHDIGTDPASSDAAEAKRSA